MLQPTQLLLFARLFLFAAALSLFAAGMRLAAHTIELGFNTHHFYWILPLAFAAGVGKALFVMRPKMQENARRLMASTKKLYPWHLYPVPLFAFIGSMILIMAILKRTFINQAEVNAALAAIDFAVGIALVIGSYDQRPPKP
jgi:hypothetical protein